MEALVNLYNKDKQPVSPRQRDMQKALLSHGVIIPETVRLGTIYTLRGHSRCAIFLLYVEIYQISIKRRLTFGKRPFDVLDACGLHEAR